MSDSGAPVQVTPLSDVAQRDLLPALTSALVSAYEPRRIILFGSTARGEAGPDSDFDILIVVDDDAEPRRRRSRLAYEVLWPVGRAGDILVMTRTEYERRAGVHASLAAIIRDEGSVLYER